LHVPIRALFAREGRDYGFDLIRMEQRIAFNIKTINVEALHL
jgi:hypothetical protein